MWTNNPDCKSRIIWRLGPLCGGGRVFWKLYVPPNFLLNLSTRPAVSTNFCLPVKNRMARATDVHRDPRQRAAVVNVLPARAMHVAHLNLDGIGLH